jgi:cell division protein FtsQ
VTAERRAPPQRIRARAAALPRLGSPAASIRRVAPTQRSLLVGCALLVAAAGAYVLARETSAFAIRSLVVSGAPPDVGAQVQRAVAPLLGTSLVSLDGAALERRVEALPTIVNARYDRAFPHTLRITVVPERAAAVVRSGRSTWLVSARARIVRRIARHAEPGLPRIWLPTSTRLEPGAFLDAEDGGRAAVALAVAGRFPVPVRSASLRAGALVFHLRSGLELRLGEPTGIRLKLAVARRALAVMPAGMTYLDVSVPGRPVAGTESVPAFNSQVSSGG